IAVDLPAPEYPVMTTKSSSRGMAPAAAPSGSRCPRRMSPSRSVSRPGLVVAMARLMVGTGPDYPSRPLAICLAAGAMQVGPDLAGGLARQAGRGLELLARGRQHRLGRAEVRQQRALARRPDPRQVVEDRRRH